MAQTIATLSVIPRYSRESLILAPSSLSLMFNPHSPIPPFTCLSYIVTTQLASVNVRSSSPITDPFSFA